MLEIVEVTNMKKSGVSRVRNKMVLVLVIANAMLFLASVVQRAAKGKRCPCSIQQLLFKT